MNDAELLNAFVEKQTPEAFAQVVLRHQNWVHSVCLRRLGDPSQAEDAAQAVFIALLRHAGGLAAQGRRLRLEGWLHAAARHAAANLQRGQARRTHHEREAAVMTPNDGETTHDWADLAPALEPAIDRLNAADREAILLRFYVQLSVSDVALRMAISEEAAKKRVQRAVGRLRALLSVRQLGVSAAGMGTLLLVHAVQPAPPALARATTAVASGVSATPHVAAIAEHISRGFRPAERTGRLLAAAAWAAVLAVVIGVIALALEKRAEPVPKVVVVAPGTVPAAPVTAATAPALAGVNLSRFSLTGYSESQGDIEKRYARVFDTLLEKQEAEVALAQRAGALPTGPARAAAEAALRADMARTMVHLWDEIEVGAAEVTGAAADWDMMAKVPRLPVHPRDVQEVYPALRERMQIHVLKEENVQPLIDSLNGHYVKQKAVLAQMESSPQALAAFRRLLDAGNQLNLTNDAPGGPEQFDVRVSMRLVGTEQTGAPRFNALSGEITRDGDRCAMTIYWEKFHVPLLYATNGLAILVSATAPGDLLFDKKGNPEFSLSGSRTGYHFGAAVIDGHAGINVNPESIVQSLSSDVRLAQWHDDALDLSTQHTLTTFHLNPAADVFPIRRLEVVPLGQEGPELTATFDVGNARQDLLGIGIERFQALHVAHLADSSSLLSLATKMAAIYAYLNADLEHDPRILATARELGKVVPEQKVP